MGGVNANADGCGVYLWNPEGEMKNSQVGGVRIYEVDKVLDQIWLTCCTLHTWLLDIDGLSDK